MLWNGDGCPTTEAPTSPASRRGKKPAPVVKGGRGRPAARTVDIHWQAGIRTAAWDRLWRTLLDAILDAGEPGLDGAR